MNDKDKVAERIMFKALTMFLPTVTWFTNYLERRGADSEQIKELRTKLSELREELNHMREDF